MRRTAIEADYYSRKRKKTGNNEGRRKNLDKGREMAWIMDDTSLDNGQENTGIKHRNKKTRGMEE